MQYPIHVQTRLEILCSYHIGRGSTYNKRAAARIAANAATMEAGPRETALLVDSTEVEDGAVDEAFAGLLVATTDGLLVPVNPVEAALDETVLLDPELPLPPPWDGERPPPEETMLVAEAAEEREEAPLATEETEPEAEAEIEPETEAEIELETDDALLWEDEPDPEDPVGVELDDGAEVEEDPPDEADDEPETALQERSNNGVVLKVEPTIPKLGEGTVGSASWRVNHQVLTLPRRGHATASQ